MKSVMEEASTIIKAIEKGWVNAGQPKEFTIKIYEEPQWNFLGLTTRSAKIGIFFNDERSQKQESKTITEKQPHTKSKAKQEAIAQDYPKRELQKKQREVKPKVIRETTKDSDIQQLKPEIQENQPVWNEAMIGNISNWMKDTLKMLQADTEFTVEPQHFYLRIVFNKPIFDDKNREKYFFASLSTLFLQMLKLQYKRPLKGYKLVFIGA